MYKVFLGTILTVFFCSACLFHDNPLNTALKIGNNNGFEYLQISSSQFEQVVFLKTGPQIDNLMIYIEGDGSAWARRYKPSNNPSPHNPLALRLASLDPYPSIAYIARPCQYTGGINARGCDVSYWTSHRFSDEVVNSTSEIISKLKEMTGAKKIDLVGYSGGGAVAILIAMRRTDVASVRTVAGNLDHIKWTQLHGVSPLEGSLNPTDQISVKCKIPQLHYVGSNDNIIPIQIAESYCQKAGNNGLIQLKVIQGCTHSKGWANIWTSLCADFYKSHE
ncbi:alpha/beta hydrolase [Maridesulfovibrio ferrireducens]|uniref:alpha/beta hydrolase n=1 Tax=Maridesulfovibrio ferrireducens TaxID=246191 RepID=UPI001A203BE9|nr:dienelactone hydrolase family protein [Maridesulfovibrio ferrireducens]MBI9113321.1 dienelactone hydrolase family protein [Maridesulfovibrio ferrireducens]